MPDPRTCTTCGHTYVVPSLARDCNARHVRTQVDLGKA